MRLALVSNFAAYWKRYPVNVLDLEDGMSVGGGEENHLRCAAGLAELGHEVHAWHYGDTGVWRGVQFNSLSDALYSRIASEKWDAVAVWSGLRPLLYTQPGTKRLMVQQLNDLACAGDWNQCDCVVSPSANHATMVYGWGWRGSRAVVHNGLDVEQYQRVEVDATGPDGYPSKVWAGEYKMPWAQRPLDVGYWSSPDRGLHHLLRAWPSVVKAEPKAKLHVFYEVHRYLEIAAVAQNSYFAQRGREIGQLLRAREGDTSIVFHGNVPRKKLAKTQRQCRVMCYPYDTFAYCEGFSGSTNQGIACGALVMATPKDALPSLYGDSVYWMNKSTSDLDFHEYVAEEVVKALHGELPGQEKILADAAKNADRYTWKKAALQFEAVCRGENWVEGPP